MTILKPMYSYIDKNQHDVTQDTISWNAYIPVYQYVYTRTSFYHGVRKLRILNWSELPILLHKSLWKLVTLM